MNQVGVEQSHRYRWRIVIRHPSMAPDTISSTLGIAPQHVQQAGAPRFTPKGRPLEGTYPATYWNYHTDVVGPRKFFGTVPRLIGLLQPHRQFLKDLVNSGGSVELIAGLEGSSNIGDVLGWRIMTELAAMNIGLGIEVF